MTTVDRALCRTIRTDAEEALAAVAAKHGLSLKFGAGRFDSTTYTLKVDFVAPTEDGIPSDFARHAPLFGLTADDYGKMVTMRGETYTIVGIKPRSHKYPILMKRTKDGKTYKWMAASVVAALGHSADSVHKAFGTSMGR